MHPNGGVRKCRLVMLYFSSDNGNYITDIICSANVFPGLRALERGGEPLELQRQGVECPGQRFLAVGGQRWPQGRCFWYLLHLAAYSVVLRPAAQELVRNAASQPPPEIYGVRSCPITRSPVIRRHNKV